VRPALDDLVGLGGQAAQEAAPPGRRRFPQERRPHLPTQPHILGRCGSISNAPRCMHRLTTGIIENGLRRMDTGRGELQHNQRHDTSQGQRDACTPACRRVRAPASTCPTRAPGTAPARPPAWRQLRTPAARAPWRTGRPRTRAPRRAPAPPRCRPAAGREGGGVTSCWDQLATCCDARPHDLHGVD